MSMRERTNAGVGATRNFSGQGCKGSKDFSV